MDALETYVTGKCILLRNPNKCRLQHSSGAKANRSVIQSQQSPLDHPDPRMSDLRRAEGSCKLLVVQQREWKTGDSTGWKLVDDPALPGALQVLGGALRDLNYPLTVLGSAPDDVALITTVAAIEAVVRKNDNVEVRQLIGGNEDHEIVFLCAGPAAVRDLFIHLRQDSYDKSWPLLLATRAASLPTSMTGTGLSIRPTGGRIIVNPAGDRVEFDLYLLTQDTPPQPIAFEPIKKPIGEPQDNLLLRAEWFKRRTGQ